MSVCNRIARLVLFAIMVCLMIGCAHIETADRSWEASIPWCDDMRYRIFEFLETSGHRGTFVDACRTSRDPQRVPETIAYELCLQYETQCGPIGDL